MTRKATKPIRITPKSQTLRPRAFDDVTNEPCPVCLDFMRNGQIQPRAVMPLPKFPARLRADGRQCCRDCQATETTMAMNIGQHPMLGPARLTISNERCEGLVMPFGMMELMGLCKSGLIRPCSLNDLDGHAEWLAQHGIPDSSSLEDPGDWD